MRWIGEPVGQRYLARPTPIIVTGCDVDWRLERDHRVPYARSHTTSLDGLGRMCWWHHLLKTRGWVFAGGPGCYRLTPPGSDVADADGHGDDAAPVTTEGDPSSARGGRAPPRS